MHDIINILIDNYNIPLLTVFLLWLLMSINPCPLATNITALAYLSKHVGDTKKTLLHSTLYILGRAFSYISIAVIIFYGFDSFDIQWILQGYGDKILWPLLIIIALFMFGLIKIPLSVSVGNKRKNSKLMQGYLGSFLLGVVFALAFCPYSGVLYFAMFLPIVIANKSPFLFPWIFALGTSILMVAIVLVLAFATKKIGALHRGITKAEKYIRYIVSSIFLLVWFYYTYLLIKWALVVL